MAGYVEDTKGYKVFDTSTLKTFVEISVWVCSTILNTPNI